MQKLEDQRNLTPKLLIKHTFASDDFFYFFPIQKCEIYKEVSYNEFQKILIRLQNKDQNRLGIVHFEINF